MRKWYWTEIIGLIAVLDAHGKWWRSGGREGLRANLEGANLAYANLARSNLAYANLEGANLAYANLEGANLEGANLARSNLAYANLEGVPVVDKLDARSAAVVAAGGVLDMASWHGDGGACGTTHCRAGWAIHLAGEEGRALERRLGPSAAGALIYAKSVGYVPNFHTSNEVAMADILKRAKEQRVR